MAFEIELTEYLYPNSDVTIQWGTFGAGATSAARIDNGIATPDDTAGIGGALEPDYDQFGLTAATFEGVTRRIRVQVRGKVDSNYGVDVALYNATGRLADSSTEGFDSPSSYSNKYTDWMYINLTTAECADLEVRITAQSASFDVFVTEVEVELDTFVPGWSVKFEGSWACAVNCTWDGDSFNVSGPGLKIGEIGTWNLGYRPTKIRMQATHNQGTPWDLDLVDYNGAVIASLAFPVAGGSQWAEADITWGSYDIWRIYDNDAPGVGNIENIAFFDGIPPDVIPLQDDRVQLRRYRTRYLVHLALPSKTLYLSDRSFLYDYTAGSQFYENYLFDLGDLPINLARLRDSTHAKIALRFRNDPALTDDFFIELDTSYRFTFADIEIYELRYLDNEDEVFAEDVKTLVFRGQCGQPTGITRAEFKIDCQPILLAKRDRLPLAVVTLDDYPAADPDDIGAIMNTLYGALGTVPCHAVVAGAVDFLTDDIDASQVTIQVSGDTKVDFSASGTIQINSEQISYSGFVIATHTFTGCVRGLGATDPEIADKGDPVFQVLSNYDYLVADHPVHSIDNVYVDGVRQIALFTAYTGQSGDELGGYAGKAVVRFSVKPVIEKQVNVPIITHDDPVAHTDSVGDDIGFSVLGSTIDTYPYAVYISNHVTNAGNAWDGNENTYASLFGSNAYLELRFPTFIYGTINTQYMHAKLGTGTWNFDGAGYPGNWTPATVGGLPSGSDWIRLQNSGGVWHLRCRMQNDNSKVNEVYKTANYNPTAAKTGSAFGSGSATGLGTASLTGNSSANTVIGEVISVDVEGYRDDGSGTYTGSPNTLITRPDHVIKHILIALLGESISNISTSFATSGSSYGSTYKFAFIMHEIASKADQLLNDLAFQARSRFAEWNGIFELVFMGSSAPTADITFTDDDLVQEPVFGFTPEVDIRNRIYAHYNLDYRKGRGQEAYDEVSEVSDATSISDSGERIANKLLSACRTAPMANDWVAWYLIQVKNEWRITNITVPWIGKLLDPGDTFILTWDFWNGVTWDITRIRVNTVNEQVQFTGQEWPS